MMQHAGCQIGNTTLSIHEIQTQLMRQTYLCLHWGHKTPATRWKPQRSACFWAVRRVKETVRATLQRFVALPRVAAVLLIVATWQDAVAAAVSLGCDWRPPGKAPGVPDKRSFGLRVAAPLGGSWRSLCLMKATNYPPCWVNNVKYGQMTKLALQCCCSSSIWKE